MEGARGDDEEVAMTSETYLEGELAVRRSLEESFLTFLSTARDALVALLREHGKGAEVAALMQGKLATLNLSYCKIGDDGAEIVANFLKDDETVKKVWLYGCKIGLQGAKAIAECLKHNQTVELMNPQNILIGDEGLEALIDALNFNVCMEGMYLFNDSEAPELKATIKYLTQTRNEILIPTVVRRASLYLIAARRNIADAGNLAIFPKEIVKMIAMQVWATRKEPIWINAHTESERTGKKTDE